MKDLKSKTLCELIDFIVQSKAKGEILDIETLTIYNNYVDELSNRLSISKISAIIFSYILFFSIRGSYQTKREVVTDVANESTIGIYLGLQELIKCNFIKYYRNFNRKPEICFYTMEELDRCIIDNKVPYSDQKSTVKKTAITVSFLNNNRDYWIFHEKNKIGIVYNLVTDFCNYTAVVGDYVVVHDDTIDGIVIKLNQLLQEDKLNLK